MKYLVWILIISAAIIAAFVLFDKFGGGKVTPAKGSPKPDNPDGENPTGGEDSEQGDTLTNPGDIQPDIFNFDDLLIS